MSEIKQQVEVEAPPFEAIRYSCDCCSKISVDLPMPGYMGNVVWELDENCVKTSSMALCVSKPDNNYTRISYHICPDCWSKIMDMMYEETGKAPTVTTE